MFNYLIQYATENIWCAPEQDLQYIVQPARITPLGGVWGKVRVGWRQIALPVASTRFHVYQIGQIHPLLLGLFPAKDQWMTLAETCNLQKMMADVYAVTGVQMPRFQIWYRVLEDKNIILAIKEQDRVPINLDTTPIYLRVYSNEYFASRESDPLNDYVEVAGAIPTSTQQLLDLQTKYEAARNLPGHVYAFVNGYKVSGIDLFTAKLGDVVEYVYDSSIKLVIDFKISELQTFASDLDEKVKYLLHYAGYGSGTIDYQDDIDVFVYKPMPNNRHLGVYYHRNAPNGDAMRMVTHKDYSVPVDYVYAYGASHPDFGSAEDMYLRLHIRKAGMFRPLVFENSRIFELYKLDDAAVRGAMLGIDSTVDVWRAPALEASAYTEIMRWSNSRNSGCLTPVIVQEALGYNAISKLIGDTPKFTRTESSRRVVDVPYGLQSRATAYEYDAAGKLISWYSHTEGSIYAARNNDARLIEMISGFVNDRIDEDLGSQTVTLDPTANYRMYRCPIVNGVATEQWTDVTGSSMYAIVNGTLTWLIDQTKYLTLVRGDKMSLGATLDLPVYRGVLSFTLQVRQARNGVVNTYPLNVPLGELDLFLNGYSLIEELDYFVRDLNRVVITNKRFLVNPETDNQRIQVRMTGFCNPDLSRTLPADDGFVVDGMLSFNNRYDVRDDKVMRFIAGGVLYDRSELKFPEDQTPMIVPDVPNGTPYLIRDIIVPLRGLTADDTYSLRAKSLVIDKQVSDYMTEKYPQPIPPLPNVIPEMYPIYSPFCCRLMQDLLSGSLWDDRLRDQYGSELVVELCAPYLDLLRFDPTQTAQNIDYRYVIVHPHNLTRVVSMDIYLYKFLRRAVQYYLSDRVALSEFISVAPSS